jgi:DNA topoisomerase IB
MLRVEMDDGLEAEHRLPAGLHRSDVHAPGYRRVARERGFVYMDPAGGEVLDPEELHRIKALAIPPAWHDVWISPDPLGHVQAMGRDARGRRQYRYHALWRAERDAEKFGHMLSFAQALPRVRGVGDEHLARRYLDRERVSACAIRVTELGLFRIGTERYAREDHTYGVASLERRHVSFRAGAAVFDYVAKHGRRRTVHIEDPAAVRTLRSLQRTLVELSELFVYRVGRGWRHLTSGEMVGYLRSYGGGHFMVKEFRTWNATLLAALALSGAGSTDSLRTRRRAVVAAVREAAAWLGDTPAVARASYIDPAVIELYESTGSVGGLGPSPVQLPAHPDAEREVLHALLEQHASRGAHLGE